jgi:uncharacterized protein YkvS
MSDKFSELNPEIIESFNGIVKGLAFPTKIEFLFVGSLKQKKLIKISKSPDILEFKTGVQVVVSVNEELYTSIETDTEALNLLIIEELEGVHIDFESGKLSVKKPDYINTTKPMVDKFGIDEIKRAKDLERLTLEQLLEAKKEAEQQAKTENSDGILKRGRKRKF